MQKYLDQYVIILKYGMQQDEKQVDRSCLSIIVMLMLFSYFFISTFRFVEQQNNVVIMSEVLNVVFYGLQNFNILFIFFDYLATFIDFCQFNIDYISLIGSNQSGDTLTFEIRKIFKTILE